MKPNPLKQATLRLTTVHAEKGPVSLPVSHLQKHSGNEQVHASGESMLAFHQLLSQSVPTAVWHFDAMHTLNALIEISDD